MGPARDRGGDDRVTQVGVLYFNVSFFKHHPSNNAMIPRISA
jgi:hypothetical protein